MLHKKILKNALPKKNIQTKKIINMQIFTIIGTQYGSANNDKLI